MITLITLAGVVEGGPQEYKRVKGGDTMANIKRTKLVLRFNIPVLLLMVLYSVYRPLRFLFIYLYN